MEKIKKLNMTRQQADLLLITLFFIAAIVITIVFRINENASFQGTLR